VLGVGAALLVACGSSSSSLIPAANAGFLQSDFNAVASSVAAGDCAETRTEVEKTQSDLASLPPTINAQLLATLTTGVQTLADRAVTECKQAAGSNTTTTVQNSTPTQTQPDTNTNTNTTTTTTVPVDTNTQPTGTDTAPVDTNTDTQPTDTTTGPPTTPTTQPTGVGGAQAPGTPTAPSDPSGGTPGGGT
jgi:chitinase